MWIAIVSIVVLGLIAAVYFYLQSQPAATSATKTRTQQQTDSEHTQRLCYLLKIVIEHSSTERRDSSTREVIRIGEAINEEGGFRYMVKIHKTVTEKTTPKVGAKLKSLWKGIGEWRG